MGLGLPGGRCRWPWSRSSSLLAFVPSHVNETTDPVDNLGGILSVLLVGALILAINFAPVPNKGSLAIGLGVIAVAAALAFVIRQRRGRVPLYDLHIAGRQTFWVAACVGIIVFGSLMGAMFIGQQYLQNVLGYDTLDAGLAILPAAVMMVLIAPRSAELIAAKGSRFTLLTGYVFCFLGFLTMLILWKENIAYWKVGLGYAFIGAGVGFAGTPASHSLTGSVPVERAGMASGTADLQRDLGGAIMQSILGALLTAGYAAAVTKAIAGSPEASTITDSTQNALTKSFSSAANFAQQPQYQQYSKQIVAGAKQSFIDGQDWAYLAGIIAILLGATLVFIFFPKQHHEDELLATYRAEDRAASRGNAAAGHAGAPRRAIRGAVRDSPPRANRPSTVGRGRKSIGLATGQLSYVPPPPQGSEGTSELRAEGPAATGRWARSTAFESMLRVTPPWASSCATRVLVHALVVDPERVGQRARCPESEDVRSVVPCCDPDRVERCEARVAGRRRLVEDPGAEAAVEPGAVATSIQTLDPPADEVLDRRGALTASRVRLHVVVDRRQPAEPEALRRVRRGGALCGALGERLPRVGSDLRGAPERGAGRLRSHPDGQEPPTLAGDRAHPRFGQVRLRAAAVGAADVHTDARVGRRRPRGHHGGARCCAGVEAGGRRRRHRRGRRRRRRRRRGRWLARGQRHRDPHDGEEQAPLHRAATRNDWRICWAVLSES